MLNAAVPAHNLPARLTSFVGRERELAEIGALVQRERLVSLVGAPGVGKTRLALQSALGVQQAFPDGIWLVELAPLADPDLVPHAVAGVLGVREETGRTLEATLADWLRTRRLLLVLDNCEHLVGAVAALAETLLHACPSLHVLATSRELLAIDGEATRRVPSLAGSEAVGLFVERAGAVPPMFALTERNAALVEQICARLDGIPLAIELAAARVRALSVEQIAARLDHRFRLLTGGSRTALRRQQTLRGAMDWSYDLLSEPEQRLLRHLTVFAGGFTLDAVDAVASEGLVDSQVDLLLSLVDKSLVQVEDGGDGEVGERRYRLLETFREYGLEKLVQQGEVAAARDRHRDHFLALAEEIGPVLNERADRALLARLEREHDNLRAALDWCLDAPDAGRGGVTVDEGEAEANRVALGVRLALALWRFWFVRGYSSDGRRLVARVLAELPVDTEATDLSMRAFARLGLANLSAYQGGYRNAVPLLTAHLAYCRETGDDDGVVTALHRLGYVLAHLGEFERGAKLCEESVGLARQLGDPHTLASALHTTSGVYYIQKRYEQSLAVCDEAMSLYRTLGNRMWIGSVLQTQSLCLVEMGDLATATRLSEEMLRICQEIGHQRGLAMAYQHLGRFAMLAGDPTRAAELFHLSFALVRQIEDRWLSTICLSVLAHVKVAQGTRTPGHGPADAARKHLVDAARLFAAADLLREQDGMALPADVMSTYDGDMALLRERLGEEQFARARGEGRAMSCEQAVEYAYTITAPAVAPAAPAVATGTAGHGPAGDAEAGRLTAREREVAALIVAGRTNREIAEALVLSERTVDSHVRNILGKLEINSRAQIAAWAVRHGLTDAQ